MMSFQDIVNLNETKEKQCDYFLQSNSARTSTAPATLTKLYREWFSLFSTYISGCPCVKSYHLFLVWPNAIALMDHPIKR